MQATGLAASDPMPTCPTEAPQAISVHHDAVIKKVANGFIVKVGCKTLVAREWKEVATGLGEYWKDPLAAEKKYCAA
jgi:hypothetical protein